MASNTTPGVVIDLPRRERKATIDVNEYFRDALGEEDENVATGERNRKRKVRVVG